MWRSKSIIWLIIRPHTRQGLVEYPMILMVIPLQHTMIFIATGLSIMSRVCIKIVFFGCTYMTSFTSPEISCMNWLNNFKRKYANLYKNQSCITVCIENIHFKAWPSVGSITNTVLCYVIYEHSYEKLVSSSWCEWSMPNFLWCIEKILTSHKITNVNVTSKH